MASPVMLRSVRHRPLNLLTALCLLLCVLTIIFTIKSFWQHDQVSLVHAHRWQLTLEKGGFTFEVGTLYPMEDISPATGPPHFRRTGPAQMFSSHWQLSHTIDPFRARFFASNALGFGGEKWFEDGDFPASKAPAPPVIATGQEIETKSWFFPAWLVIASAALLPGWWLWKKRDYKRNHRRKNQLCPTCGYDLRATPDRCPECGTLPAKTSV
jgi:hypothetical protein